MESLERLPCAHQDGDRVHRNLGHPSAQRMEKVIQEAKVSDEATEALKHILCDARSRLKQPPAVATGHTQMFNDVVSMDVTFWKLKERHTREKNTLAIPNIVDAASGMHIASQIPYQISHTLSKTFVHDWLHLAGAPKCFRVLQRAQIMQDFFDQPKDVESFRTLFLLKLSGTLGKSRTMRGFFARWKSWTTLTSQIYDSCWMS